MKSVGLQLLVTLVAVATVVVMFCARGLPPDRSMNWAIHNGDLGQVRRNLSWGTNIRRWFGETPLHEYVGTRDAGDLTPIRDLHIEGRFEWDQGTISLVAPGDWSSMVYFGPGQIFYNWQIEEGDPWTTGNVTGFGILVDSPTVTNTPFHWTDNPQLPLPPDLGSVVSSGTTSVPVPEPATMGLLGLGLLGLLTRHRK